MADIGSLKEGRRAEEYSVLNGLFGNNGDAVVVTDFNFSVKYLNPRAEMLLADVSANYTSLPVSLLFSDLDKIDQQRDLLIRGKPVKFQISRSNLELEVSASSIHLNKENYFLFILHRQIPEADFTADSLFKPLVQHSPIATGIFLKNGKPLYINKAYRNLFTISSNNLDNVLHNYSVFEDEQLMEAGLMPFINKCLSGESVEIPTVKYNPTKTKSLSNFAEDNEKYVRGSLFPLTDNQGAVKEIVVVLTDVTYQKQAEQILTEAHLKFQMLNLNLPGAIYEFERDAKGENGRFIYMSQGCQEIFGIEPERVISDATLVDKLIHPDDYQSYKESSHIIDGQRKKYEWEGRIVVNDEIKWVQARSSLKVQQDGTMLSYGVLIDITEKKIAEEQFHTTEQLFKQLFENSPLGIVLLNEDHKVMQVNQGFVDLFEFSNEEVIGHTLNNIIVPEDMLDEAHEINILTGGGEVGKLESLRRTKRGNMVPVIIYGVPVLLKQKTIGIYGIYVDISHRKKAEKELEIRNDELDNFVYKVSHDLRAPLSSILGLVNLASHDQNNDDLRTYIELIGQRVKQLDTFISDVLSHSKNLKLELMSEEIDFKGIIDKCFKDLSYLPEADRIAHLIKISDNPFYSDQWRISEVMRNLISNAIKYIDPNKEDPYIKIDINIDDKRAEIIFEDNGVGIEEEQQPKIFNMFYRATVYSEGSGIGLYIVKNAIEKLGGTINLTSEPQKGTTFAIQIPNSK